MARSRYSKLSYVIAVLAAFVLGVPAAALYGQSGGGAGGGGASAAGAGGASQAGASGQAGANQGAGSAINPAQAGNAPNGASTTGAAADTLRSNNTGSSPQTREPGSIQVPPVGVPPLEQPGTEAYDRARSVPGLGLGDPRDTQRQPQTRSGVVPSADGNNGRAGDGAAGIPAPPNPNRGAVGITLGMGSGGLMIDAVAPNSPAFLAGLRAGDLIVGIDQQYIRTPDDVTTYLAAMEPGREVQLILQRDGTPMRVATRVGAWSDVYRNVAQRRTAYLPNMGGEPAADLSKLRSELQTLRDEVRQLRESLRATMPNARPEQNPAPAGSAPLSNRPADQNGAATTGAIDRPPLP